LLRIFKNNLIHFNTGRQ